MPRGPLPNPNHRHRNQPTIPTTALPAAGRKGAAPHPPAWIELGAAGLAWWKWAWHTPQATAWSKGMLVVIARRASLEDRLAAVRAVEGLDFSEVGDDHSRETIARLKWLASQLSALATGEIAIAREARELEKCLGLTPKAMADLRWSIEDAPKPDLQPVESNVRRMRAMDSGALAGA